MHDRIPQPPERTATPAPELAARYTAASAALADFRADLASAPLTSPPPMAAWALRLASALGTVLAGLGQGETLTDTQRSVLGQAIADAIDWRTPGLACFDCDGREIITPCPDHLADLELCESYRALAVQLGIEVDL